MFIKKKFIDKNKSCPVTKILNKIEKDIKDKTHLKLKEHDIFVGKEPVKKKRKKRV